MKSTFKISAGEPVENAVHSGDLGVARASHIRGWEADVLGPPEILMVQSP